MSYRASTSAASAAGTWFAFAALLLAAPPAAPQRLVPGDDPAFPRVEYADSLVSPNDRCIVARNRLNPKVRPVYVNRIPIGFC